MEIPEETKATVRHHLGYMQVNAAQTYAIGVPANVQTQYQLEGSWNRLMPSAAPKLYKLIEKLECLEEEVFADTSDLEALKLGDLETRPDKFKEGIKRYLYWRAALGNMFACEPNPYDQRFLAMGGMTRGNVPVAG